MLLFFENSNNFRFVTQTSTLSFGLLVANMIFFCIILCVKIRMGLQKHFHPKVYSFHSFGCCSFWNRYIFSSYLSSYSHFFGLHSYQPNWENMRYIRVTSLEQLSVAEFSGPSKAKGL